MLITFSGLDSSGKSTQIELLKKRLLLRGIPVKVIWARGGYTPIFEYFKKLIRFIGGRKIAAPGHSPRRTRQLSNEKVQKIWLTFASIDLIIIWSIYARILSSFGYHVICDRYIEDTILDFKRNFPTNSFEKSWIWRFLIKTIPKAKIRLLFWVPVNESLTRSAKKNEPFPDDKQTLEWRFESYMNEYYFPDCDFIKIDGRNPISQISEKIYQYIIDIETK
tara:strand:- start:713 stop:1375 length:663 start_codon:yes stop_codon:yes gene_type:complete